MKKNIIIIKSFKRKKIYAFFEAGVEKGLWINCG